MPGQRQCLSPDHRRRKAAAAASLCMQLAEPMACAKSAAHAAHTWLAASMSVSDSMLTCVAAADAAAHQGPLRRGCPTHCGLSAWIVPCAGAWAQPAAKSVQKGPCENVDRGPGPTNCLSASSNFECDQGKLEACCCCCTWQNALADEHASGCLQQKWL